MAAERFNLSIRVERPMLYLYNQARITCAIASFNTAFLKIILISWKGRNICVVHAFASVFQFYGVLSTEVSTTIYTVSQQSEFSFSFVEEGSDMWKFYFLNHCFDF
jgi:hypothetical protein